MNPFSSATLALIVAAVSAVASEFVEVNGIAAMEAEHATRITGWKQVGGNMVDAGSGGLEFKITFNKTGDYYIWVRGATGENGCPPSTAGNDCLARFDGKALLLKGYSGPDCVIGLRWPNSGCKVLQWQQGCKPCENPRDWSRINSLPVYAKVLSPGVHTFSILHRSTGLMIDRVVMQLNNSAKPSGIGPAETVLGRTGADVFRSGYRLHRPRRDVGRVYSLTGSRLSTALGGARGVRIMSNETWLPAAIVPSTK